MYNIRGFENLGNLIKEVFVVKNKFKDPLEEATKELWQILQYYLDYLPGIWNVLDDFGISSRKELVKISFPILHKIVCHLEGCTSPDLFSKIGRRHSRIKKKQREEIARKRQKTLFVNGCGATKKKLPGLWLE